MRQVDVTALDEDPNFYLDLGNGVWLMDDHRWAFYIWQRHQRDSDTDRFSLIHADYHWDCINVFYDYPDEKMRLLAADDAELLAMVAEDRLIRYDSFIAPAVIREVIGEIHFYCPENEETDLGLDDDLVSAHNCRKVIHSDYEDLPEQDFDYPLIFDLCLDLFNRSNGMMYEADIWSEAEVDSFLNCVRPLVKRAELVTVSMSFGYSGLVEDTRCLTDKVLCYLQDVRGGH
ncbi:MAG: UPF0489 family protein [Proteobacteria bacterium]|nr:UPF0489 family protein [Pseudomonadota bacterium]